MCNGSDPYGLEDCPAQTDVSQPDDTQNKAKPGCLGAVTILAKKGEDAPPPPRRPPLFAASCGRRRRHSETGADFRAGAGPVPGRKRRTQVTRHARSLLPVDVSQLIRTLLPSFNP